MAARIRCGHLSPVRALEGDGRKTVSRPPQRNSGTVKFIPPNPPSWCNLVHATVEKAAATNFVIDARELAVLTRARGVDVQALLPEFVAEAQKFARSPTSQFRVGAAALGASGAVYLGVNIELPGLPLNASIHAEQFAVVTALHAGETSLSAIATTAAPCGHCRQFLNELRDAASIGVIIPDAKASTCGTNINSIRLNLSDLLPHSFGPLDLNCDVAAPLMLEPRDNSIVLISDDLTSSEEDVSSSAQLWNELSTAALRETNLAYAPYSGSPAGIAIATASGNIFSGRSLECAAYNPTLSPLHTALVVAVGSDGLARSDTNGSGGWEEITRAVLVEMPGGAVQYAGTVELILGVIAPEAQLRVVHASDKAERREQSEQTAHHHDINTD